MKTKECTHDHAYRFHENGPLYCPDCDEYLELTVDGKLEKVA